MEYYNLISQLNAICWYNGVYEPLTKLREDIKNYKGSNYLKFDDNLQPKHKDFDNEQFEIFYMLLVLLFGNYGTSPRSGWLEMENRSKIIDFINKLVKDDNEIDYVVKEHY